MIRRPASSAAEAPSSADAPAAAPPLARDGALARARERLRALYPGALPQGSFARHALALMTGTVVAQAIPVMVSPILTRIYTPSDFGLYAVFMAIIGVVAPCATCTYEQAVMLPKSERHARDLVGLTIALSVVLAAVSLLVVLLAGERLAALAHVALPPRQLLWVPLYIAGYGVYQAVYFWLNRNSLFRVSAASRVVQALAAAVLNLALGLAGWTASGLVAGAVLAQLASAVYVAIWFRREAARAWRPSWSAMREQARTYSEFPRYNLAQTFLDGLRDSALAMVIAGHYSTASLGFYVFATRILKTPLSIVGSSLGQVFYQKASALQNSGGEIWPHTKRLLRQLMIMAAPISLFVVVLGPTLFRVIFGAKWEQAGTYSRVLAPWIIVNFLSSPLSMIPIVMTRQRTYLRVALGYNFIVPATAFALSRMNANATLMLLGVSLAAATYLGGIIVWITSMIRARDAAGASARRLVES